MAECVRVTACRLCDGGLDLVYAFTPTPPGDQYLKEPRPQTSYPLDLMGCRACGAVQLADTVDPALIYPDYTYTTSISPGLGDHFRDYAQRLLGHLQPALGALMVDIGSNDGTLLRVWHRLGYRVQGLDPARTIADQATASGVPTRVGWLTAGTARDLRMDVGPAQIVTANHVMANVADLHDFLEGVRLLLAPEGTFVFETGYWPAIMRGMLIDTIEHEHIHYFAVEPLLRLFARHELRLVHVEAQPTKGGSLRGYVRHAPASPDETVSQFRQAEEGLDWRSWALAVLAHQAEVQALVAAMPTGDRWVGYGAAVGSTLQMYHFSLWPIVELWDDNASRHGLVSPGFHLPVTAPNHAMPVDTIVLLAWRYADRIMAAHPEHAGRWILPLPTLRVA